MSSESEVPTWIAVEPAGWPYHSEPDPILCGDVEAWEGVTRFQSHVCHEMEWYLRAGGVTDPKNARVAEVRVGVVRLTVRPGADGFGVKDGDVGHWFQLTLATGRTVTGLVINFRWTPGDDESDQHDGVIVTRYSDNTRPEHRW